MMHGRFQNRQYRYRAQAESGFSRRKRRLGSALTARNDRPIERTSDPHFTYHIVILTNTA
jgi:transposase